MKLFFILAIMGMIGIVSGYNADYFAFGYHEDKQETHFSNPLISIQNDKADIIWESYHQDEGSEIIFTQLC